MKDILRLFDHYVNPDIAGLLAEVGYNDEFYLYTQVFDFLEQRDLYIHDLWISPIKQWSVTVIEKSTGKRLWPEYIFGLKDREYPQMLYYPERRIAWNIAIISAINILKSKIVEA